MTEYGRLLTGSGLNAEVVGAKGAALDRLIALEVPVPPTAAITTDAYRAVVAVPVLHDYLRTLQSQPIPPPERHGSARDEVDDQFLKVEIPPTVAAAIAEFSHAVLAGCGQVAVRSSANAEDLGSASFAGQYRSFLDVSPSDVERAARLTWASLWHPAPRSYRRFHGISEQDLAMSVLFMRMLEPELAGVVFTRDPGAAPHSLRIEFVHGLGESLVSGAETPDACVVDRDGDVAALAEI
jgi:rifampicin phosphotransferase